MGEAVSFEVQIVKIRPPVFAVGDDKKKREERGRKGYHTILGLYFSYMGTDFYGSVEGAHDVIILSNFGFNTFRGFWSTGGQNFHLPTDFAGHRYNSAAATAQPVTNRTLRTVMARFNNTRQNYCLDSNVLTIDSQ